MTDLSGRVNTIENQLSYFTQDLLNKVDVETLSRYNTSVNQSQDQIYNTIDLLKADVSTLQSLYAYLVSITGATTTGVSFLETFETINKNLKQYSYTLHYDISGTLDSITYATPLTPIYKLFNYNTSGAVSTITISGTSLNISKNFYYSGTYLTGVNYT